MENYYSTDYDKILEEQRKKLTDLQKTQQDAINKTHDSQINIENDIYNKAVNDTNIAYESNYERNAVQKLINEKTIAEKNANLGLTDSGLNRTQQTAVNLSYGNQKGAIDLAKQSKLDSLSRDLAVSISNIEQSRISSLASLDASIEEMAQSNAKSIYNANVAANEKLNEKYQDIAYKQWEAQLDADTELQKAFLNSAGNDEDNILLYDWKGESVLDDGGNLLLKFVGSDGKKYNVAAGKNPYTNTQNAKISDVVDGKCVIDKEWQEKNKNSNNAIVRACAKFGVFSNGYQPKGICVYVDGEWQEYKLTPNINEKGEIEKTTDTGKVQTVWTANGKKYLWRGDINCYEEVET